MHEIQNPENRDCAGFKLRIKSAFVFLLALNLLCCSALHKNSFQKANLSSASDSPLGKTSRKLSLVSPQLSGKSFSITEDGFADPRALDEIYDRFVTEVDFEIREGTAQKNQKRVLSGLQNLRRLFPSVPGKSEKFHFPGPGKKEASIVFDRVNALLDSHLMNFSAGNPTREDYRRVAEDYRSLMEGASEYFKAGFKQDEILQGLVRRKGQTAGVGFFLGGLAAMLSISGLVVYLGLAGMKDEYLAGAIIQLNKYLKVCSEDSATEARKKYKNVDWQKRFYRYLGFSYAQAETVFCSQDPKAIDAYEDVFGDVDDNSRDDGMCERIGALSSEDCFFRERLCENVRKLKSCLQRRNIQIEWLSSG